MNFLKTLKVLAVALVMLVMVAAALNVPAPISVPAQMFALAVMPLCVYAVALVVGEWLGWWGIIGVRSAFGQAGALFQSDYAKGILMMPTAQGPELVSARAEFTTTAAALNDIWEMLVIPVDHQLVDLILDADDLDSNGAPTITLSVAYLNAAKTDIDVTANINCDGAAFIVSSTIGQAGGMARPTTKSLWRSIQRAATPSGTTPTNAQLNSLGIKATAAAATHQAGKLGLTAIYRAGHFGK